MIATPPPDCDTQTTLQPEMTQRVTSFMSNLIGVQGANQQAVNNDGAAASDGDATAAANEAAAESISNTVLQLATVATASAANASVSLYSPNLNLTSEARPPTELAARPITCDTGAGEPAEVMMPADILLAAANVNTTLPISVLLYTTAFNLHSIAVAGRNGSSSKMQTSATVAFSLVQKGSELKVEGSADRINVSVPFTPTLANTSDDAPPPCLGTPTNATDEANCPSIIECRFWNITTKAWASDGCTTVRGTSGAYSCSCNHLTDVGGC